MSQKQEIKSVKSGSRTEQSETKQALEAVRKAEMRIKEIIVIAMLSLVGMAFVNAEIEKAIKDMIKELPPSSDKRVLANGLWQSALKWEYLIPKTRTQVDEARLAIPTLPKTPAKAVEQAEKLPTSYGMADTLIEARKLPSKVKGSIELLSGQEPSATPSYGVRPISEWSEAETEVRWGYQKERMEATLKTGGDLFRISVHQNCSDRCFPDQGKIVSKTLSSVTADFKTGQSIDGQPIYSLTDMLARTDKYGYHNFILSGFNCRHFLKPYEKGDILKPSKEEASETSKAEQLMRDTERRLRGLKAKAKLMSAIDKQKAAEYEKLWYKGIQEYESFANKWGIPPQEWRAV